MTDSASAATITDNGTGQVASFDGVVAILRCPGADGTVTLLRSGAGGTLTLWSGPYRQPQVVPLPATIGELVGPGEPALVLASPGAELGELGLFSLDATALALTELVPPALATGTWAEGAMGAGPLSSGGLAPAPAAVAPAGGQYVYERSMNDGSTVMFAGLLSSAGASELALFPVSSTATVTRLPQLATPQGAAVNVVAWQYEDSASQTLSLFVWDDDRQVLVSCPLPAPIPQVGMASPDGSELLFGATTPWDQSEPGGPTGPLMLVSVGPVAQNGGGACTLLASGGATNAEFSSDGTEMFWLADAVLWVAAGDGSVAHSAGGNIAFAEFVETTKVEFQLEGDVNGGNLAWIDAASASDTLHYVANQVFGPGLDLDPSNSVGEGSWLVTGYDFSLQAGTGTLGVVNRDTGVKRLISPEVAQYVAVPAAAPADGGVSTWHVVYLVRGRNASAQDGIWMATIGQADLQ